MNMEKYEYWLKHAVAYRKDSEGMDDAAKEDAHY